MHLARLSSELFVPREPEAIFGFFADAYNLETITPPWLRFQVLTPRPIVMAPGTLIDYRLTIRGLPLRWRSEITVWEPPVRFVDEMRRGPYRRWRHEHTFTRVDGGTLVGDAVEYAVPGGVLVDRLVVRRDVEAIFAFRRKRLAELLVAG